MVAKAPPPIGLGILDNLVSGPLLISCYCCYYVLMIIIIVIVITTIPIPITITITSTIAITLLSCLLLSLFKVSLLLSLS